MPIVIEMRLKASWTVQPDTRQLHGLACALFEGVGAEHLGSEKPFTVWPLRQASPDGGYDWDFRAAWLAGSLPPATALIAEQLRYGHVACAVVESRHRSVSFAQIAAGGQARAVRVKLASPAYFAQNGARVVVPDPRLIAGSWRRRWNGSLPDGDPLQVSDETWRETHRALSLAEFDLRTEPRDSGYGRDQAGMVGWLILRMNGKAPPSAARVLGTLSRFAEFCGTGAQTTHGFGATTVAMLPGTPDV